MGLNVGAFVGAFVGDCVGDCVGERVGAGVGDFVIFTHLSPSGWWPESHVSAHELASPWLPLDVWCAFTFGVLQGKHMPGPVCPQPKRYWPFGQSSTHATHELLFFWKYVTSVTHVGVGAGVGAFVGAFVGAIVGALVGLNVGAFVGAFVGDCVGDCVGERVGAGVGALVVQIPLTLWLEPSVWSNSMQPPAA